MAAKGEFTVKVNKKEVVATVLPMQEHWLPQSNLDLIMPALDVGVFFCYRKPPTDDNFFAFGSMSSVLKKAMAQALVSYYPFAGEIVHNSAGEPELLCNNRGVDFIEAYADVELEDLNLYNPDESVEGKLVPKKKQGVLCVQATELKCGGLVVACSFDHRVADAYSTNMFLVSWAEMAQSKPLSLLPSFRRSLLNPRRPGFYSSFISNLYVPMSTLPPPPDAGYLVSRIFYITADKLSRLQSLATLGEPHRSKVVAFCAFLWKLFASGLTEKDKVCRLGIMVDGRWRLSDGETNKSKSMTSYFGNVLSTAIGEKNVAELTQMPLSSAADAVHEFLKEAVTKDHFLEIIDCVEANRPNPGVPRVLSSSSEDGPALVVSSGQRFPMSKVEFGWGKPVFWSYDLRTGGEWRYVMPMPSPVGNGDWVVYMHMRKREIEVVEREGGDIFRPLTYDYLNVN